MNRHIPGVRVYLMKGERGARVGGYVIVYEFDSLERRNEYAPKPDSASERSVETVEPRAPSAGNGEHGEVRRHRGLHGLRHRSIAPASAKRASRCDVPTAQRKADP